MFDRIEWIEGLDKLLNLELLELGDNKIKAIKKLSQLKNLRELYLGKNKIEQIEGISELANLKILSLPVCFCCLSLKRMNISLSLLRATA